MSKITITLACLLSINMVTSVISYTGDLSTRMCTKALDTFFQSKNITPPSMDVLSCNVAIGSGLIFTMSLQIQNDECAVVLTMNVDGTYSATTGGNAVCLKIEYFINKAILTSLKSPLGAKSANKVSPLYVVARELIAAARLEDLISLAAIPVDPEDRTTD